LTARGDGLDAPSRSGGLQPSWRRYLDGLRSRPVFWALVSAHLLAAALILSRAQLQSWELLLYDGLVAAWAGDATTDRFLLVAATEEDLAADDETRWPWPVPDDKLAQLLERLASRGPRAIGVDIYRPFPIYRGIPGAETDALDDVLRRHPNLYWVFLLNPDHTRPGTGPPRLLRGTDRAVFADIPQDFDGIVRRGLLFADDGTNQYIGMGMGLALAYLSREGIKAEPAQRHEFNLGKSVIRPLDASRGPYSKLDSRGYQILLDYRGGPRRFQKTSFSEIMDRDDVAALVRDRIVLIGMNADTVKDWFWTPLSASFNRVSGIEVHAYIADQIIRRAIDGNPELKGLPRLLENLWIWGAAVLAAILVSLLLTQSALTAFLGLGAGFSLIVAVVYMTFGKTIWLPPLSASLAWLGSGGLTILFLYRATSKERVKLRNYLRNYVPETVIKSLISSGARPFWGGERREITVLFTDVAGFTSFSETRDPEELAEITNAYFEGIVTAIFTHEGLVNEFAGDGVLAFFGAPQDQPDHADRAVEAAREIDRFAEQFSADQRSRGVPFGHTRIGIHTGEAFVGILGARKRQRYGAIGDILNTASRLEGLNKQIGTRICISGATKSKCRRNRFKPVADFILAGKQTAIEVYVPIDPAPKPPKTLQRYESAYRALETGDPEAASKFSQLYAEDPSDPCVRFHHVRLTRGECSKVVHLESK
jgi:adenylate cyclase